MTRKDEEIARRLSIEGENLSKSLRDENRIYFRSLKNTYFSIAAALSLTWTKHATFDEEFISYAAGYIDDKIPYDKSMAPKFAARFGIDGLETSLLNFRTYYRNVFSLMPDFNACDVAGLGRLQHRLLSKLDALRSSGQVSGIGPWLFTGPFKIILGDQDRLWTENGINAIVLPTGMEVDKGINRLIKERCTFMNDFDSNWLEQTTKSLLENFATYNLVHTFISNIGRYTDTPAIHINSGLYLYGRGDL